MINRAGHEDEEDVCVGVCVSVSGVSLSECVYMTGGESLDEEQRSHT